MQDRGPKPKGEAASKVLEADYDDVLYKVIEDKVRGATRAARQKSREPPMKRLGRNTRSWTST